MNVRELDVEIIEENQITTTPPSPPTKYLGGKIEVVGQGLHGSSVYFDVYYHFTVPYDFYNELNELTHTEDLTISEGYVKINGQLTETGKIKDIDGNDGIPFSVYDVYEIGDIRYVLDGRFLVAEQSTDEKGHNAKIDIDTKDYNLTCTIESSKKEIYFEHDLSQTETTFADYISNEELISLSETLWDAKVKIRGTLHYGYETTFDVFVIGGFFRFDDLVIPLIPTETDFKLSVRTDFYGNVDNKPRFRVNLEGNSDYNSLLISFLFEVEGFKTLNIIERNISIDYTRGIGKVQPPSYTWEDFLPNKELFGGLKIGCDRKPKEKSHIKLELLDSSFDDVNKFPFSGTITYVNSDGEFTNNTMGLIEVDEVLTRKGQLNGERVLKVNMVYKTQVGNDEEDEFILEGDLKIGEDFTITNDSLVFYSKNGTQLIQTLLNVNDISNNNGELKRLKDIEFVGDQTDDVYIGKEVLHLNGDVTIRCSKKPSSIRSMEIIFGDLRDGYQKNLFMTVDYGIIDKNVEGVWEFHKLAKIPTIYIGGQKKFVFDVEFDADGNLVGMYDLNESFDNSAAFDGKRMLKMNLYFNVKLNGDDFAFDDSTSYLLFTEDYDFFIVEYLRDVSQETYYTISNPNFLENGEDLFNQNTLLYPYEESTRLRSSKRQWIGLLSSLVNGKDMFKDSKLEVFTCVDQTTDKSLTKTILTKLMDGEGMFSGCLLDTDSVKVILESLANQGDEQYTQTEKLITIGVEDVYKEETTNYFESGELPIYQDAENDDVFYLANQWKITMEWNKKS